jgi:methylase of polypeptide subunit release factors|tara:strand:+ start:169 stop:858 length:690 start_codon:yes stop_codon:yes gene_type:complete
MLKTNFKIDKKVFKPTGTSELLLNASIKKIKKTHDILDLGCGSGVIGVNIAKIKKLKKKIYFSDISRFATKNTEKNCNLNKIKYEIKTGSILKPWTKYKFDVIISDVASISDSVAKISPWYNKSIVNKAGKDGVKNIIEIIKNCKNYLRKNGKLIFPIISLSNEKKILSYVKKKFNTYSVLETKDWPLPKMMYKNKKILIDLNKKNKIKIEQKYGLIIFSTKIIMIKND